MSAGLVLKDVSKRLGGIQVLDKVRASVPAGKITAFIGPNGAGKTTLFHVIAGTLRPDAGQVKLGGEDITGLPPYEVARRGIGRQFQDVRVFGGLSVLENVLVAGLPSSAQWAWSAIPRQGRAESDCSQKEKALAWLEYVGLADYLDEPARELSFGQQKLLGLARLFARPSRLLLLDEPTAGLGHEMVKTVIGLIRRASEEHGMTVALVEHDMAVVSDLTYWVHFMHEGRVAFSGQRDHVLGNRSVRELYMGL